MRSYCINSRGLHTTNMMRPSRPRFKEVSQISGSSKRPRPPPRASIVMICPHIFDVPHGEPLGKRVPNTATMTTLSVEPPSAATYAACLTGFYSADAQTPVAALGSAIGAPVSAKLSVRFENSICAPAAIVEGCLAKCDAQHLAAIVEGC